MILKRPLLFIYALTLLSCGDTSTSLVSNDCEQPVLPPPSHSFPDFINDPLYTEQWHINENHTVLGINPEAHIHTGNNLTQYTGKNIKIAIIDDGLDITHEDLETAVTYTYNLETPCADVSHNAGEYHGTAMTGIIGARSNNIGVMGIASNSELFFLKFNDSMSDSDFITLFNQADQWGADIINNSWGTGNVSQSVTEIITNLSKNGRNGKGINIVFAVGNDNSSLGDDESAIPEVISVGASAEDNDRASYSNWGVELDILAPSGYIGLLTLDPMGDLGLSSTENYISIAGSSASAPVVSGVIALLLEKNPNLTSAEISTLLHNSAEKIGTDIYDADGHNIRYGYGKVHLSNALALIP